MAYNVFVDSPVTGGNIAAFYTARAYDASALANAFDDAGYTVETDVWGEAVADAMVSPAVWEEHGLSRYLPVAPSTGGEVSSYSVHRCAPDGTPMGTLAGPAYAEPDRAVWFVETGLYGRVRLVWRCCGAALVEMIADPDDEECERTVMGRFRLDELSPPPAGVMYSVPCVGASWSLYLPCGDIAGEGCDCDTIAAEADGQD